jgi:hypothetical protein
VGAGFALCLFFLLSFADAQGLLPSCCMLSEAAVCAVSVLALSADVVGLFLSPANASELARHAMIANVESFLVITKLLYSVVDSLDLLHRPKPETAAFIP